MYYCCFICLIFVHLLNYPFFRLMNKNMKMINKNAYFRQLLLTRKMLKQRSYWLGWSHQVLWSPPMTLTEYLCHKRPQMCSAWRDHNPVLTSPSVFSGVRVTRYLVVCVCFVDRCLSFFFSPLCFLFFFDIRILIIPLISSYFVPDLWTELRNECHIWNRNCFPFRNNWVYPRFLATFVLLDL
jgi:hypothetical protein